METIKNEPTLAQVLEEREQALEVERQVLSQQQEIELQRQLQQERWKELYQKEQGLNKV